MNFTFEETPESRQETDTPPTYTLIYKAVGEQNDLYVQNYAIAATPLIINRPNGTLYRQDIRRDPDGFAQYLVTVPYAKKEKKNTPVGSYTFSFDSTGATINVKAAKEHIKTYPTDGDWHKGAIGVKADGECEGVDIVFPALRINYSFKHPQGIVTEAYARTMANYTGKTNALPWREFEAGELLFAGATGSDGSEAEAAVDYQFVASPNEVDLTIGEIIDIAKRGHDAIWVEFRNEVHAGASVRQPQRVHIDRVYDEFDFATVFGWS